MYLVQRDKLEVLRVPPLRPGTAPSGLAAWLMIVRMALLQVVIGAAARAPHGCSVVPQFVGLVGEKHVADRKLFNERVALDKSMQRDGR